MPYAANIAKTIGNTPLVCVENSSGNDVTILGKVESFNPGGSVKDRIAAAIIDAAERSGELKPAGTIVEATSGNTGIALSMVGAAKGYDVIIAMPSSMSKERRALMRAYGAELVLTDPQAGMSGAVETANKIVAEHPNAILARQFENMANPEIHRKTTGPEIWKDTDGDVDIVVAGVGTGGTITGVGEYLKSKNPQIKVIAVEPAGSPLLSEGKAGKHLIQGLGANFVPAVLNRNILDEVVQVKDEEAFNAARQAAIKNGLLVGISSGAALHVAFEVAKRPESHGKTIVVILPDGGERYLSTALFEDLSN